MEYGPKIGLDSVYVAALTEGSDTTTGTPVWGTPVRLAGAASFQGNPNGQMVTDWGDNGPFFTMNSRGNLQGVLELIDIDPTVLAAVLGQTKANGIVKEGIMDQAPYYALGFRVWIGGVESGNRIYEYFWYVKGKFTIPTQGANTKKDTVSPEHTILNCEFVKLNKNDVMCTHARSNDPTVVSTTITNWFNAPVYETTIDLGALSVVIAESTTNATLTFTKVGGGVFSIAETSAVVGSSILFIKGGASQAGTIVWSGQGTATVVGTFTPAVAFGTATVLATVTNAVRDSFGVACTPNTTELTYA